MRYFKMLSASDIFAILSAASLLTLAHHAHPIIYAGTLIFLSLLFVVAYLDAVSFQLYSAEIEPNSIRLFVKNFKTMKHEASSIEYFKKEKNWIYIPAVIFMSVTLGTGMFVSTASVFFITVMVMLISKSRINTLYILLYMAATSGLLMLFNRFAKSLVMEILPASITPAIAAGLFITALFLEALRLSKGYLFQHTFMTQASSLFTVFGTHSIAIDHTYNPTPKEIEEIISLSYPIRQKNSMTGTFKGANVILICLESIGRQQMEFYMNHGANTPLFSKLSQKAFVSKNHQCISPNTHTSLHTLLNGDYFQNEKYPYIEALKSQGYTTTLLTPQNFLKHTKSMLEKNRYNHYFTPDFYKNQMKKETTGWGENDYKIFEAGVEDFIACQTEEKPFFLHVTNNQTHINYTVYDKKRFNRFAGNTAKHRYLNAVEESDFLMERLLTRLSDAGFLENTLIVYTSDHGQAFGELGYRAHSTAISAEEMNVPFLIHHPGMKGTKWIDASNHFDIFPTIFDLTGLDVPENTQGRSLFSPHHLNQFVGFSSTRKGGFPSNFGFIAKDKKNMIDLVLGRFWTMDFEDKQIITLSQKEQKRTLKILYEALSRRGLIDYKI
ncbi:MAG: sulfatase-like hydrolase/transferase [Desulfobacterales bacterium]|nr:sulfatase-like hydrolase/transferase [Desulfobacterales bacterium]